MSNVACTVLRNQNLHSAIGWRKLSLVTLQPLAIRARIALTRTCALRLSEGPASVASICRNMLYDAIVCLLLPCSAISLNRAVLFLLCLEHLGQPMQLLANTNGASSWAACTHGRVSRSTAVQVHLAVCWATSHASCKAFVSCRLIPVRVCTQSVCSPTPSRLTHGARSSRRRPCSWSVHQGRMPGAQT